MKLFVLIISLLIMIVAISCVDYLTATVEQHLDRKADACITSKCHSGIGEGEYIHSPVAAGECEICHGKSRKHREMPYKYKFGKISNPSNTCVYCHSTFGLSKTSNKHELYEECVACHTHHSSSNKNQLLAEGSTLCFKCHEKKIALHPETTRLTRFRNGNKNLHFEHVKKPTNDLSCLLCHKTHASSSLGESAKLTYSEILELTLIFRKTETGGHCITECHKEKSYNR